MLNETPDSKVGVFLYVATSYIYIETSNIKVQEKQHIRTVFTTRATAQAVLVTFLSISLSQASNCVLQIIAALIGSFAILPLLSFLSKRLASSPSLLTGSPLFVAQAITPLSVVPEVYSQS